MFTRLTSFCAVIEYMTMMIGVVHTIVLTIVLGLAVAVFRPSPGSGRRRGLGGARRRRDQVTR